MICDIETTRKHLSEAQQLFVPDQDQEPYSAVDKAEGYTAIAANMILRGLLSLKRDKPCPDDPFRYKADSREESHHEESAKGRTAYKTEGECTQSGKEGQSNAYHDETHCESPAEPQKKPSMLVSFARKHQEQNQRRAKDTQTQKSWGKEYETTLRRDLLNPAQSFKETNREHYNQSVPAIQTMRQSQRVGPRYTPSSAERKVQQIKEQGRSLARNRIIREIRTGKATSLSGKAAKGSAAGFIKLGTAISKAVTPSREALILAGASVMLLIPAALMLGVASLFSGSGGSGVAESPISEEVENYTPIIRVYAVQYGIQEYTELIKAVMMQESRGLGTDPMQCSESGFNTRYSHEPNSITDPEYSIDVGVQSLAYVLGLAEVESPMDLERISLALQGYNYGSGYITWALANYGGYSELNAIEFSEMMASRMGWAGYGDKSYVPHVLRYYPIGRLFMDEGSAAIIAVAQSQIGNVGGEPYWSWWGLDFRVEWCAIFVSWCADQCGFMDAGVLPKMEGVLPFIDWFRERGQWQDRIYEPRPGDIIFFDWEDDGMADHVGIVEMVENEFIYTVEGNSGDRCVENRYYLGSAPVYGFGLPLY